MRTSVITALLMLLALCAWGQTAIYVGGGPSIYSQTSPRGAGNLTVGICTQEGGTCSLTTFEARGSAGDLASLVYSTQTGMLQRIASVAAKPGRFDLFSLAQAGASVTGSAVGFAGGAGGGLSFHPSGAPNWSVSIAMRAVYSPVNPGWQPWGSIHVGYTFRTQ
ncbi:MAG: hypothetical protein ABFD60_13120 [Bryobacteraceae bacterium]